MAYWNYVDYFSFPFDLCFLVVGDDKQAVAVEFLGSHHECVKFTLAGLFRGHVIADLDGKITFKLTITNELFCSRIEDNRD